MSHRPFIFMFLYFVICRWSPIASCIRTSWVNVLYLPYNHLVSLTSYPYMNWAREEPERCTLTSYPCTSWVDNKYCFASCRSCSHFMPANELRRPMSIRKIESFRSHFIPACRLRLYLPEISHFIPTHELSLNLNVIWSWNVHSSHFVPTHKLNLLR